MCILHVCPTQLLTISLQTFYSPPRRMNIHNYPSSTCPSPSYPFQHDHTSQLKLHCHDIIKQSQQLQQQSAHREQCSKPSNSSPPPFSEIQPHLQHANSYLTTAISSHTLCSIQHRKASTRGYT